MSMENSPVEDTESTVLVSVTELRNQLNDSLKQLSPERLRVVADFVAYLASAESKAATLLEQQSGQIPRPLLSKVDKQAARLRFEGHFGTLTLEQPTDLNNESIDADLAMEYASLHEAE